MDVDFGTLFIDFSGEEALPKGARTHKKRLIFAQLFPDSSGEEAFPQGARRRQKGSIFVPLFLHILVVRRPFRSELGGAQRGYFLHNFFKILVRKPFQREDDVD